MEPILHCIFKPSRVKFRTFITSLHGNIKISFSKFAHNSCPGWGGGGGGGAMAIDLESHVKEIDAWMMIASVCF